MPGKTRKHCQSSQQAGSLLSSLGWEETDTSVHLFNNWALELDQIGRTLEAEQIERRALDQTSDGNSTEMSTAMMLNNYAKMLRKLNRLDEAADYAQRSYDKAQTEHNQLVTSQSLLERARIAISQRKFAQASELAVRARTADAQAPSSGALCLCQPGGRPVEDCLWRRRSAVGASACRSVGCYRRSGAKELEVQGAFAFPGFLLNRSSVELASGSLEQAVADANRALALQGSSTQPDSFSSTRGYAYLALARALDAQGKHDEAQAKADLAAQNLEKCLGSDHPDTRSAVQLAARNSKR